MTDVRDSIFEWASDRDRMLAKWDELIYGTVFLRRDDEGLMHRVDPTTITVRQSPDVEADKCF